MRESSDQGIKDEDVGIGEMGEEEESRIEKSKEVAGVYEVVGYGGAGMEVLKDELRLNLGDVNWGKRSGEKREDSV